MSLALTFNGTSRVFPTLTEPATLADIIAALELKGDRIAVELNGEIIQRAAWPATPIVSADRLEVVHFVGGGSPQNPGHQYE